MNRKSVQLYTIEVVKLKVDTTSEYLSKTIGQIINLRKKNNIANTRTTSLHEQNFKNS